MNRRRRTTSRAERPSSPAVPPIAELAEVAAAAGRRRDQAAAEHRSRVVELIARMAAARRPGAGPPAEQAPTPDRVTLLNGRVIDRGNLAGVHVSAWPYASACWKCGVAVGPDEADYATYHDAHVYGHGRCCPGCVRLQRLPGHVRALATVAEALGLELDLDQPTDVKIAYSVHERIAELCPGDHPSWSAFRPGAATRWEHLDLAELLADAEQARAEALAALAPHPHASGRPCGTCGVQRATAWPRTCPGARGLRFPRCGECVDRFAGLAGPSLYDAILVDVAGLRRGRSDLAAVYDLTDYAHAEQAHGWPNGQEDRWGWLRVDVPALLADIAGTYPALIPGYVPPAPEPVTVRRPSGIRLRP